MSVVLTICFEDFDIDVRYFNAKYQMNSPQKVDLTPIYNNATSNMRTNFLFLLV